MKHCVFCHQELENDAVFCTNCGKRQPENAKVQDEGSSSTVQQGQNLNAGNYQTDSQNRNYQEQRQSQNRNYQEQGQFQNRNYQEQRKSQNRYQGEQMNGQPIYQSAVRPNARYGRQYASWCRIGREQRSLYGASSVSEQEFMERVDYQLKRNHVAASIRQQQVVMDGQERKEYVVDFNEGRGDNPVSLILRYMREGIYSYVQSGLYVTPPSLPSKPEKEPKFVFKSDGVFGICAGIIVLLIGFGMANLTSALSSYTSSSGGGGAAFLIIAGLGLVGWGGYQLFEFIRWFIAHKEWKKQSNLWNNIWNAWEKNELEYAVHEMESGYLPFVYEAVIQSIQDVCHEVFDKGPVSESFTEVNDYELVRAAKIRKDIEK